MANCLPVIFLALSGMLMAEQAMAVRLNGRVQSGGKPLAEVVVMAAATGNAAVQAQTSTKPVTMRLDQKGKQFIPHVLVIETGTSVYFPNSDDIQHHVYSFSPAKRFEIKLYKGTPAQPIVFDRPGVVVLGCNIHDWMLAYVLVSETPFFTTTDADGYWSIDLPAGDYRVSLWHPDAIAPDKTASEIWHVQSELSLNHNLEIKAGHPSGKPPDTLQMQGYTDGF